MQLHYQKEIAEQTHCYHCGEICVSSLVNSNSKDFCCDGCKLVYELLNENNLCTYYSLNSSPGNQLQTITPCERFLYLDDIEVQGKLIHFTEGNEAHATFYIPKMHCSSCIWLLENLHKLDAGILSSRVDFLKKEITIVFKSDCILLSALVSMLTNIGYEPLISLNDLETKKERITRKSEIVKIGIAGFCFGNIMMLSFPEYFSLGNYYEQNNLKHFFSIINLVLSLPVFFYCASDFFKSAYTGIKQRFLNIDIPIAFAILVAFLRSIYEISSGTGSGYFDSMAGVIFFMLIGRYFQNITYDNLSFERDFKSYFPISVAIIKDGSEKSIAVSKLKIGDKILVRNGEIIPADSILKSESTYIDYSFVTGESRPIKKNEGDLIYAGGKQLYGSVILEVNKEVSQSYLTKLWNRDVKPEEDPKSFIHVTSKYFTISLFLIAFSSFFYWTFFSDINRGLNAMTTVLIVACPCALLLSATFTNGSVLRIFGQNKLYLKNAFVAEKMSKINTIVFDKTGTITYGSNVKFVGKKLSEEEKAIVYSLVSNSIHPLSRKIAEFFTMEKKMIIENYKELPGLGICATVDKQYAIVGSEYYVTGNRAFVNSTSSKVFFSLNGVPLGYFEIESSYRSGILELIKELNTTYEIHLISGDNDSERAFLETIISNKNNIHFNKTPDEKCQYVMALQEKGKNVIMLGDGLNDAGALLQSNVGISVSDDVNNFSPSCDAILFGDSFEKFNSLLKFSKTTKKIILASFILSILYNLVGISFAIQGQLSPVIAAILMPVSSISIILLTTLSSTFIAFRKGL